MKEWRHVIAKKRKPLGPVRFKDPLGNFDWSRLCDDYDSRCGRFHGRDGLLFCFGDGPKERPATDRECYERLLENFRKGKKGGQ